MKEIKDEAAAGAASPSGEGGAAGAAGDAPPPAPAEPASEPASTEPPKKKRYQRVPVTVTPFVFNGLPQAVVDCWFAKEVAITAQDTSIRETHDKRNELEAYIYSMRNNLSDSLAQYASEADKAALVAQLGEVEDWLYNGDGFDTTKDVYQLKLDGLRTHGEPISRRCFEHTRRHEAIAVVNNDVERFRKIAFSTV
jgi:hypothetical protein